MNLLFQIASEAMFFFSLAYCVLAQLSFSGSFAYPARLLSDLEIALVSGGCTAVFVALNAIA